MRNPLWAKIKQGAADVWYQEENACLLCGHKSPDKICQDCRKEYFQPEVTRCYSCGKLIANQGQQCKDCLAGNGPNGLNKAITLGHYHGSWKEFIRNVKYKGQPYLLFALEDYLIPWVIEHLPPPDAVLPVPMHHHRLAERGFNQAEVIASIFSRRLGIRLEDYLVRTEDTVSQTSLGRQERIRNLQGAFEVKREHRSDDEIVWLVDDVVTTGATVGECACILKKKGVKEVYAVCLGAGKEEL